MEFAVTSDEPVCVPVTAFLIYLPDPAEAQPSTEHSRIADWATTHGYAIGGDGFVIGHRQVGTAKTCLRGPCSLLHVLPGLVHSNATEGITGLRSADNYVRLYNVIRFGDGQVEILSDRLGMLPYYLARLGQGTLISSSLLELLRLAPECVSPVDDLGVLQFFCFGGTLGSRTLHQRVRRSVAGEVVRWRRGGCVAVSTERRLVAPAIDGGIPTSVMFERLLDCMQRSVTCAIEKDSHPVVPLTGGFDSRLLACLAVSSKASVRAVTLGKRHHYEVKMARRVASVMGIPFACATPKHDLNRLTDIWLETTEGQADHRTVFMSHLAGRFPAGSLILHGFLGDVLGGSHLTWLEEHPGTAQLEVARGIVSAHARDFSPPALGLPSSLGDLVADVVKQLRDTPEPHQAMMLWDLENKQRLVIGQLLRYLGRSFYVFPPYYSDELIGLWLSVPRIGLDGRALQRQLIATAFPQVGTFPHSEEVPQMIPRRLESLTYLAQWLMWHGVARIGRALKVNTTAMEERHVSWSVWHGTTPRELAEELNQLPALIEQARGLGFVGRETGVACWEKATAVPWLRGTLRKRLLLLGRYSEYLAGRQSH